MGVMTISASLTLSFDKEFAWNHLEWLWLVFWIRGSE